MYKKDTAVEIQFSPSRLNDQAGDPYWIDLTLEESRRLLGALQKRLDAAESSTPIPLVVSLDAETAAAAVAPPRAPANAAAADGFKQWICLICGWVYSEQDGLPDEGIAPGTRFEDIPADWRCPLCDVGKDDFALIEL
jgi:rubredoxin